MSKDFDFLWSRICLGDEEAFDTLFRKLYPGLCNFAYRILADLPNSEEVVQDAFIKVWHNRSEIVIHGSFSTYMYQIVHNLSINKLQYLNTNKYLPNKLVNPEVWNTIYNTYSIDDAFIQAFEADETEAIILKAVDKLPEKCREIFLLSRYENLTHQEIANKLQLSQNTIRVQIFRALSYLKEIIEKLNR